MNSFNEELSKLWSAIQCKNKVKDHEGCRYDRSYFLKRPASQDETGHARKKRRIDEADINASSDVPDVNDSGAAKWHGDNILWKCWKTDKLHQKQINGEGVTIAFIDSGINITHSAFFNRIVAVNDITRSGTIDLTTDHNGHGTMCASVACGALFKLKENNKTITIPAGVAPKAKLVMYKVTDSTGHSDPEKIAVALEQCLEDKDIYNIDIVLIPYGSSCYSFRQDKAIQNLSLANVLVVTASGNYGKRENLPYPARLGRSICVGAHDNLCITTDCTTKGQALDFTAPGTNLVGASSLHPTAYAIESGTSCAAACVAGLLALIIQFTTKMKCNAKILKQLKILSHH